MGLGRLLVCCKSGPKEIYLMGLMGLLFFSHLISPRLTASIPFSSSAAHRKWVQRAAWSDGGDVWARLVWDWWDGRRRGSSQFSDLIQATTLLTVVADDRRRRFLCFQRVPWSPSCDGRSSDGDWPGLCFPIPFEGPVFNFRLSIHLPRLKCSN